MAVILFLIALTCITITTDANREFVSFDFDCDSYKPISLPNNSTCQKGLETYRDDFEACKTGNQICFFFVNTAPFSSINVDNKDRKPVEFQRPFKCSEYENAFEADATLTGIDFKLISRTSGANDLCASAGNSCEFNDLVNFIEVQAEKGYKFGIMGHLLETPQRQCLNDASVATLDDSMVILGPRETDASPANSILQLFRPFHWGSWLIFVVTSLLFVVVCFTITWKLNAYRRGAVGDAIQLLLGQQGSTNLEEEIRSAQGDAAAKSFAARNGVVTSLFRVAIGAYILIFILFYEVAVVNFLFLESTPVLSKRVSRIPVSELKNYGILKNSALESVWLSAVDPTGRKIDADNANSYPWERCKNAHTCMQKLRNGDIQFVVMYGTEARVELAQDNNCDKFAIYKTRNALYAFNAGSLYNSAIDSKQRKQIDRELLALRINGEVDKIFEEEMGVEECSVQMETAIPPLTILIPVLGLVFPWLLGALLALFFWDKITSTSRSTKVVDSRSTASERLSQVSSRV